YAKVNTRRVFLRQEVDDGRVLRAFLEQASRSVARSERVRATASVERSFSVGSQQWDPRWREDRRDPRGRECAVASRASARRDRDDSRRCLRIVATPEKEAIVRALPRSSRRRRARATPLVRCRPPRDPAAKRERRSHWALRAV